MKAGDRVVVRRDLAAADSSRVRPLTGHVGTVEKVTGTVTVPNIKVRLEASHVDEAWFREAELEVVGPWVPKFGLGQGVRVVRDHYAEAGLCWRPQDDYTGCTGVVVGHDSGWKNPYCVAVDDRAVEMFAEDELEERN